MEESRQREDPPIAIVEEQIDRLVELGYPGLAGRSEESFRALLAPLTSAAADLPQDADRDGRTPYVVVVTRALVDPYDTVPLLRLHGPNGPVGKPGVVDRNHADGDLATYHPLEELAVPAAPAYLLVDVERGEEFCGVRPEDALPVIRSRGRTPLTIDEGIAVVTHAPQLLEKNKCFMLSGSRRHDRRVPALWISDRAPKLGWCWDGNPHTWLGVASAGARMAAG
ncbi:DUF5701 family protein [Nocardioides sp.]|uniref:DUF5701 family protein n=1 Tax=Nocardioides sp. TaxID=35761 RepID=UPI0027362D00|nr:DUF5701 family protein [Nocardioides sp.]MDP3890047.1 DUF5701 family protein [Nocardioides sp.]